LERVNNTFASWGNENPVLLEKRNVPIAVFESCNERVAFAYTQENIFALV
jgi:hypothetical protein